MTAEKIAELFTDISGHIASIDAKLTVFVEKLADHERRLCEIEHPSQARGGLVATLAKAIVYMAAALAAGAGASGILSKFGG